MVTTSVNIVCGTFYSIQLLYICKGRSGFSDTSRRSRSAERRRVTSRYSKEIITMQAREFTPRCIINGKGSYEISGHGNSFLKVKDPGTKQKSPNFKFTPVSIPAYG
jgi:hypothetical protein